MTSARYFLKSIVLSTPFARYAATPSPRFRYSAKLENTILVGTHHKTGTMWLQQIFYSIGTYFKLKVLPASQISTDSVFDIALSGHSQFPWALLAKPYKGLHMIRDPRDMIVSACDYHLKSTESWLHVPKKEFGGLTYQEKLTSYNSDVDRIMFEMEHSAYKNIVAMSEWDYSNTRFLNVRYEDLMEDSNLELFHDIFLHLGFQGESLPTLLSIAYEGSMFSGRVDARRHKTGGGKGKWADRFNPAIVARFKELFGELLVALEYEESNEWAVECLG